MRCACAVLEFFRIRGADPVGPADLSSGLSILSVYFYCRYLDSGRATADYLVISVLLFFVALATYSIQCGVPIAVFLLLGFVPSTGGDGRLALVFSSTWSYKGYGFFWCPVLCSSLKFR